jgi:hypothetical protein
MGNPARLGLGLALLLGLVLSETVAADSIFDTQGLGRDVIPAVGQTRQLGGAVVASNDPLLASIINPCASIGARGVTISGGFAHQSTATDNFGQSKKTVSTSFPSVAVVVPLGRLSFLTGLYVEKMGGVTLAEEDTLTSGDPGGAGTLYDATYRREVSIHSVPLYFSARVGQRLVLSSGVIVSLCDLREENTIDFRSDDYVDTDDVADAYALGENFAGAIQLDLGKIRVGGIFRTGSDLNGSMDRTNKAIGIWSTEDIMVSSRGSMRVGVLANPVRAVSVELDYDRNPWSRLAMDGRTLTDKPVERWAVGLQYRGDWPWRASRYPLSLGYYRQPVDWRDSPVAGITTGEITEQVFSAGIAIPMVRDRATVALGLEFGTRKAAARSDLDETFYALCLSVSVVEAWHREVKR